MHANRVGSYPPDSSRSLDVELIVEMLPVNAARAHPNVRMSGVAYDPVPLGAPVVPAGCNGRLGETATIKLGKRDYESRGVRRSY